MNIQARDKFYDNELNLDRATEALEALIKQCTLSEVFYIFRTIVYDQVAYWSEDSHSIIYDEDRDALNIEQANRLQQQLSSLIDLYGQSIVDKRTFDEGYLKDYEFARPYLRAIDELKGKNSNG